MQKHRYKAGDRVVRIDVRRGVPQLGRVEAPPPKANRRVPPESAWFRADGERHVTLCDVDTLAPAPLLAPQAERKVYRPPAFKRRPRVPYARLKASWKIHGIDEEPREITGTVAVLPGQHDHATCSVVNDIVVEARRAAIGPVTDRCADEAAEFLEGATGERNARVAAECAAGEMRKALGGAIGHTARFGLERAAALALLALAWLKDEKDAESAQRPWQRGDMRLNALRIFRPGCAELKAHAKAQTAYYRR